MLELLPKKTLTALLILLDLTGKILNHFMKMNGPHVVEMTVIVLMDIYASSTCGLTTVKLTLVKDAGTKLSAMEAALG